MCWLCLRLVSTGIMGVEVVVMMPLHLRLNCDSSLVTGHCVAVCAVSELQWGLVRWG